MLGKQSVFCLFRIKLGRVGEFQLSFNDQIIKAQNAIKYLGVTLDRYLSGDIMVNSIINPLRADVECR